jgi:hypothetical protein
MDELQQQQHVSIAIGHRSCINKKIGANESKMRKALAVLVSSERERGRGRERARETRATLPLILPAVTWCGRRCESLYIHNVVVDKERASAVVTAHNNTSRNYGKNGEDLQHATTT